MDNGVMVARIKCQDGWIMVHQDQEEEEEEAILHCDRGHWRGKTKICKGEVLTLNLNSSSQMTFIIYMLYKYIHVLYLESEH